MKLKDYIKDKLIIIFVLLIVIFMLSILFFLFDINELLSFMIMFIIISSYLFIIVYDYLKRRMFYNNFKKTLDNLDKKYLITEMIKTSDFADGKLLLDYLSDINRTMHEEINDYKYKSNEFREYLEMWCHEIKTPISSCKLVIENNNSKINKSILEEIEKIEVYLEQVMYYSKIGTLEKDYFIMDTNIKDLVEKVIKRNKKDLISKKIKIDINMQSLLVASDSKWLEFIINQIIINSIKYSKDKESYIKISSIKNKNNITLTIEDNGIGIKTSELPKVFEKGYTGSNGRKKYNSTGIGLYLCKKMCDKLEHSITIDSIENKFTIVTITFPISSMNKF